ncbi:hypothetical protein M9Y10_040289 [Tritrichomonas musculus]|uniref:DUF659 domain-containing protein n=1 Tax=Tritrichomonas musculus TaxID=1915356 RepID=A0ABR2GQH3_9EUKA
MFYLDEDLNFTNNFGIIFFKIQTYMEDSKKTTIIYHCSKCGKYLLSKTGASLHNCIGKINRNQNRNDVHKKALESFLRYIATANISLRSATNPYLQLTFQILDQTFVIPNRNKLSEELKNLSKRIHQNMLTKVEGKTVSLMCDGSSRWGVKYQGIIVYTYKRLYVYSVNSVPNNQSLTLAELIASVVNDLSRNNTTVVAVCCDNARSNISAFNGNKNSAQQKSGKNFIRQPCAAHTANLVIKDSFDSKDEFGFVYEIITFLMRNKPEESFRKGFAPALITERWSSLFKCVHFIRINFGLYKDLDDTQINEALNKIQESISWENLERILEIMWNFIETVEKDYSCIADIVPAYLIATSQLQEIDAKASQRVLFHLKNRFYSTLSLNLPLVAFLLTKPGLIFYRKYHKSENRILMAAINGLVSYQKERKFEQITIETNRYIFVQYLSFFDESQFNDDEKAINTWLRIANENVLKIRSSFFKLAIEILQIPSSEAAVERLFAALSRATRGEMCNSNVSSLNARMIVKFDSIFKELGSIKWEDFAEKIEHFDL